MKTLQPERTETDKEIANKKLIEEEKEAFNNFIKEHKSKQKLKKKKKPKAT